MGRSPRSSSTGRRCATRSAWRCGRRSRASRRSWQGRFGSRDRLPRRRHRGVRVGRRHLRVRGAAQGHGERPALQRPDRRPPTRPFASAPSRRRDDLRLLHGRRDGGGDGVRPALRGRGLEIRHSGRAPRASSTAPTRSASSSISSAPPTRRTSCSPRARWTTGRRWPSGFIQRLVPAADLERYTYDYLRKVADNAPLSVRGAKLTIQSYLAGSPTSDARQLAGPGRRGDRERGLPGGHARVPREARAADFRVARPRPCAFEFLTSTPLYARPRAAGRLSLSTASCAASGTSATPSRSARSGAHRLPHARPLALQRRRGRCPAGRRRRGRRRPRRVSLGAPGGRARRAPAFVVMLKGIIADELRNERGWCAPCSRRPGALGASATRRARIASSCPAATRRRWPTTSTASRRAKLAVVPEPIDLVEWRRRFAEVEPAALATRPTVLSVARMYPRKRLDDLLRAARCSCASESRTRRCAS